MFKNLHFSSVVCNNGRSMEVDFEGQWLPCGTQARADRVAGNYTLSSSTLCLCFAFLSKNFASLPNLFSAVPNSGPSFVLHEALHAGNHHNFILLSSGQCGANVGCLSEARSKCFFLIVQRPVSNTNANRCLIFMYLGREPHLVVNFSTVPFFRQAPMASALWRSSRRLEE